MLEICVGVMGDFMGLQISCFDGLCDALFFPADSTRKYNDLNPPSNSSQAKEIEFIGLSAF